jgi:type IV secretory pathway TraG/TraD family ATPase VirD4
MGTENESLFSRTKGRAETSNNPMTALSALHSKKREKEKGDILSSLTVHFHFHACTAIKAATANTETSISIAYGYATVVTFIVNSKRIKTA